MKVGTKSILFGVHQFILHPILVCIAWWQLYGFPDDIRLWVAFIVHDIGYWGKPNMDGTEGETHPLAGARLMARWFGEDWGNFCLLHSRFYARRYNLGRYSKLCVADKQVIVLEPWWLYLPRAWVSGELDEYVRVSESRSDVKYGGAQISQDGRTLRQWYEGLQKYMREWIAEHKDLKEDTWTPKGV